jgi:hypothetical protein
MLGRAEPLELPRAWVTGAELSTLLESFDAVETQAGVDFVPSSTIGPIEAATFRRSDNFPFAQQGVVAHTIAAGRIGPLYHAPDDEVDTMDFDRMEAIVRGIARGVEALADSDTRPEWTPRGIEEGFTPG